MTTPATDRESVERELEIKHKVSRIGTKGTSYWAEYGTYIPADIWESYISTEQARREAVETLRHLAQSNHGYREQCCSDCERAAKILEEPPCPR